MLSRKPDRKIRFDVAHLNIPRTKGPFGARHKGGTREFLFPATNGLRFSVWEESRGLVRLHLAFNVCPER